MKDGYAFMILLIFLSLFSCSKSDHTEAVNHIDFFIKYQLDDSLYVYQDGDKYSYYNEGSSSIPINEDQGSSIKPDIYFGAVDDLNTRFIGFIFETGVPHDTYFNPQLLSQYGDKVFSKGNRTIVNSNIAAFIQPYDMLPNSANGVIIYWRVDKDKYYISHADVQPEGSFFSIDSVVKQSYKDNMNSWRNYELVLFGHFSCRVYNPENKNIYKDITNGQFVMPAWRDSYY